MMTTDEYNRIIAELMDELPQDFFRKLNGGVIVSDSVMVPDYAKADDLYAMGQYLVYSGIRQIVMYKGSFDRVYPNECTRALLTEYIPMQTAMKPGVFSGAY